MPLFLVYWPQKMRLFSELPWEIPYDFFYLHLKMTQDQKKNISFDTS